MLLSSRSGLFFIHVWHQHKVRRQKVKVSTNTTAFSALLYIHFDLSDLDLGKRGILQYFLVIMIFFSRLATVRVHLYYADQLFKGRCAPVQCWIHKVATLCTQHFLFVSAEGTKPESLGLNKLPSSCIIDTLDSESTLLIHPGIELTHCAHNQFMWVS